MSRHRRTPTFFKAVGFPFDGETARVRMEPDGHVTVFTAQMPHGQSHETTISQLVAETLGLPLSDVRVVAGDTQVSPFNMVGTGGSRAATFANGAALLAARALRAKLVAIAGKMLEVQPEDVDLVDGGAQLTDNPEARVGFADIAMGAYMAPSAMPEGVDLDLEGVASYDGEGGGFSQSTHCCWVEVDRETGTVTIPRYLIVEDCGPMINPAVVEGQIRGATAMGLSGMLLERIPYDDDGNCLVESFFDYFVASADRDPGHRDRASRERFRARHGVARDRRGRGDHGAGRPRQRPRRRDHRSGRAADGQDAVHADSRARSARGARGLEQTVCWKGGPCGRRQPPATIAAKKVESVSNRASDGPQEYGRKPCWSSVRTA